MKRLLPVVALVTAGLLAGCILMKNSSESETESYSKAGDRVTIIGKISIAPGSETNFLAAVSDIVSKSRKEPGNLRYYFLQSLAHPQSFITIEAWRNRAALDTHLAGAAVAEFQGKVGPLLAGAPSLQFYGAAQSPESDSKFLNLSRDSSLIYCLVEVNTTDNAATFLRLVKAEVEATRKEPGNSSDEVFHSTEDKNRVAVVNTWKGQAGLDAHFAYPYVQEFLTGIGPSLVAPPAVETYKMVQ